MNKSSVTRTYWIIFILFLITDYYLSFLLPIKSLVNFFFDDSCYYIKTAYNLATGMGSTFDGVNITNGYQPLWFITLTGVFYIISLICGSCSPQILLRITTFIHFLFFYFTFYFTLRSFKLLLQKDTLKICMFLCVSLCITPVFIRSMGMEMSVTTLLFAIYFWLKSREFVRNEFHMRYKIIILILISFARIDFFFSLVPILILYEAYDNDIKKFTKNLFKIAIPVIFVVTIYFVNNYIVFGHLLTISGAIKSTFPDIQIERIINTIFTNLRIQPISSLNILISLAISLFLGLRLFLKKNIEYRKIEVFLFFLMLGFTVFIFQNIIFNREMLREWYFAGPIYIAAISVTFILRKRKYLELTFILFFLGIFTVYTYNSRVKLHKYDSLYDYAIDLKNRVPEDKEILQIDYSGLVGLFSERKVINGDGLINSFEYYDYMKNNTVCEYIKKYHIDYFSTYLVDVDSNANTVTDKIFHEIGGWKLTFPMEKIVFRKQQNFDSYIFGKKCEWLLISLN